jgi:hypothetical protein
MVGELAGEVRSDLYIDRDWTTQRDSYLASVLPVPGSQSVTFEFRLAF